MRIPLLLFPCVMLFANTLLGIEPWEENRWYWSHLGQPVMLLGGSDDDNLFQWPEDRLVVQLDRIVAAGGNVVRNTMSDRKDGGFEVYAFRQLENGKYDLTQWNPEYWKRFECFLRETAKRRIFVQIEVWDRFDCTDNRASDPKRWEGHPYNPPNNVNYTAEETGLTNRYPEHPGQNKQPFFYSPPKLRDIRPLLKYQEAFVHKLLDHSLKYQHVLYCIDNETKAAPEWAEYWTALIRERAGQSVSITEMWDDWDLSAARHRQTFDHPELYDFVDVSQNNQNSGRKHWDNFIHVRELLHNKPRPMNTTKTYGADGNKFGHSDQDGIERFWRHLLGGAASIRFHRPDSGLGISDKAIACIKAARQLETNVPFWNLEPAEHLLQHCEENEAYAASTGNQSTIAIFFPASSRQREIELVTGETEPHWQVTWIDIDLGSRHSRQELRGRVVMPPKDGNIAAVLRKLNVPMLAGEMFQVGENKAFVFLPSEKKRKTPQPWVMYGPTLLPNYPDEHERWMHEQFLDAGIAVAGVDVGEAYGSPRGNKAMDRLYKHMTENRGFSKTPCLLGRSRGGLWVSSWAADNPNRVSGIAGIYPAFDLHSYPGLDRAAGSFDMSAQGLQSRIKALNPISKARTIAEASIPAYIIHGAQDRVVPLEQNSTAFQQLYDAAGAGASITLEVVDDQGHNYWPGFFRSQNLINFVIQTANSSEN